MGETPKPIHASFTASSCSARSRRASGPLPCLSRRGTRHCYMVLQCFLLLTPCNFLLLIPLQAARVYHSSLRGGRDSLASRQIHRQKATSVHRSPCRRPDSEADWEDRGRD